MADQRTTEILLALGGSDAPAAWETFLDQFSPVLQQVIAVFLKDADSQADCFVYVCEQLAENNFRRLRKFDSVGPASFVTWLRAIVHHLCIDWRRKETGRFQPFSWVKALSRIEQDVFCCLYRDGDTVESAFAVLSANTPGITLEGVEHVANTLAARLTPRERWLLSTRHVRIDSIDDNRDEEPALSIPDLSPTPERVALDVESQKILDDALASLPASDRLLIQMRFEQDLTLSDIARIAGMKDAQTADRKIRDALDTLRTRMAGFSSRFPGKTRAASV